MFRVSEQRGLATGAFLSEEGAGNFNQSAIPSDARGPEFKWASFIAFRAWLRVSEAASCEMLRRASELKVCRGCFRV